MAFTPKSIFGSTGLITDVEANPPTPRAPDISPSPQCSEQLPGSYGASEEPLRSNSDAASLNFMTNLYQSLVSASEQQNKAPSFSNEDPMDDWGGGYSLGEEVTQPETVKSAFDDFDFVPEKATETHREVDGLVAISDSSHQIDTEENSTIATNFPSFHPAETRTEVANAAPNDSFCDEAVPEDLEPRVDAPKTLEALPESIITPTKSPIEFKVSVSTSLRSVDPVELRDLIGEAELESKEADPETKFAMKKKKKEKTSKGKSSQGDDSLKSQLLGFDDCWDLGGGYSLDDF